MTWEQLLASWFVGGALARLREPQVHRVGGFVPRSNRNRELFRWASAIAEHYELIEHEEESEHELQAE